ncbi:hypothetical protein B0T24DRAFT_587494 [Lasiosphaeria ovina]|uniref:Uncharacterized protein n=1 Tax=Lasiosphaeria ovina TaxID=92902 RepID=A0AAE0NJU2_9PEZI|nr:hypothetical protein B0T24DRAFT_587494 [Lasiosphaeria ovina]
MHFITSMSSVIFMAMALGASALTFRADGFAKVTRQDPHIGDIRIFGETGCLNQNLGVWTVTQSGLDTCNDFSDVVKSVTLTDINDGCSFFVWAEAGCRGVGRSFSTDSGCGNVVEGIDSWGSFAFTCPTSASKA